MQDNLKSYIDANRSAFDFFDGPDLWRGIQSGLHSKSHIVKPKSISNMIKYGFGASVVIVTTSIVMFTLDSTTGKTTEKNKIENIEKKQVEIIQTSSIAVQDVNEKKVLAVVQEKKQHSEPLFKITDVTDTTSSEIEFIASGNHTVNPIIIASGDSVQQIFDPHKVDTLFRNVTKIEVECKFIDIRLIGTTGDAVKLQGEIHQYTCENMGKGKSSRKKNTYLIRYKQKNELLTVWIENFKNSQINSTHEDNDGPSYINLEVPNGIDLDVKNSSGNISLSGCKANSISLKTQFGNIKLAEASGNIKLLASSGGISGSQLNGTISCNSNFGNVHLLKVIGNISVQSSSGSTNIEDLKGDVSAVSTFGSQKYNNINGNIQATATSGSIKVFTLNGKVTSTSSFGSQVFNNIVGDIKADASSGIIKVSGTKGKLDLSTAFGSIKGEDVTLMGDCQFKASSGNINIDLMNDFKELKFDLRSSAGMITVGEGDSKSKSDKMLQIGDGNIFISGVSSFGSQNYH